MLALGTVAGALDASFSSSTDLELYQLALSDPGRKMKLVASMPSNARYHALAFDVLGSTASAGASLL